METLYGSWSNRVLLGICFLLLLNISSSQGLQLPDYPCNAISPKKTNVNDVNEAPTEITLDNLLVKENLIPGSKIGTLSTTDPDNDQTFTYTLTESAGETGYFAVDGDKLIAGKKTIDYEKKSEHRIFINSTDSGKIPKTIQTEFTIKVEDVNEPPIRIILETLVPLAEDAPPKTILSKVQVDDPDADQSNLCKVMTSSSPFSILTNEKKEMSLVLSGSLDYESKAEHTITLQCTDGKFSKEEEVTIKVKDVNEPPESISLSGSTRSVVADAKAGYVIGQLSVSDPDIGQTHVFTIQGNNSDLIEGKISTQTPQPFQALTSTSYTGVHDYDNVEGKFKSVKNSGLQLKKQIPEFYLETNNPVIQIMVVASDNGDPSLSVEQTFTLPITNIEVVADKLPQITIDNKDLKEDAEIGTVIGTLHNRNKSLGKDILFELVNNTEGLFRIKDNKYLVLDKNLTEIDGPSRKVFIKVKNTQTFEYEISNITVFIERIDKCNKNGQSCHENARCVQIDTGHRCQCESGFEGDGYTCQDKNDCIVPGLGGKTVPGNPCQNQGICFDEVNDYACECQSGFNGKNCEIAVNKPNPCKSNPCKNKAVCILDEVNTELFTCGCTVGWTGSRCNESVDDCKSLGCYGGGKCIDKHRTIVCECPPERKGVWCEYMKTTCVSTNTCDDPSYACIPKKNIDSSDCVVPETQCLKLKVKKPSPGDLDRDEFTAKTKEVITDLCNRVENKPTKRKKRETVESGVDTYIVDLTDNGDGTVDVTMAIRDPDGNIYNVTVVMSLLRSACNNINSHDAIETTYCPAVMILNPTPKPLTKSEKGLPIPIIAGAAGGLVLLIIIMVAVIIVCKKKQSNSTVDPTRDSAVNKDFNSEPGSRRSSGYSSLRRNNNQQAQPQKQQMSEFHGLPGSIPSEGEEPM